jgi:hypothetical protein
MIYCLGFSIMANTFTTKPDNTKIGATEILVELKISGLNTFGSSDPPPDISTNPTIIKSAPTANNK